MSTNVDVGIELRMTPAEHDNLAHEFIEESRAVRVIADRLEAKALAHRRAAEDLRKRGGTQ